MLQNILQRPAAPCLDMFFSRTEVTTRSVCVQCDHLTAVAGSGAERQIQRQICYISISLHCSSSSGSAVAVLGRLILPNNSRPESRHFNRLLVVILSRSMNLSSLFGAVNPPVGTLRRQLGTGHISTPKIRFGGGL